MTYIILRNIPSYTIICLWSAQSPHASCLSRSRNQGWLRCLSPSCIDEAHNLTCGERDLLILLLFLSHTGGSCIRFIRSYWYWDSWRTCLLLRANRWCLPEIHVHICIHGLPEIYVLTCIHGNRMESRHACVYIICIYTSITIIYIYICVCRYVYCIYIYTHTRTYMCVKADVRPAALWISHDSSV